MHGSLERFTSAALLSPTAQVSVTRQQVRRVEVHWHDFYELVHVTGGSGRHQVNGVVHDVAPGSTVLLTPADFHRIAAESDRPLEYYNVVVDAGLVEERLDGPLPSDGQRPPWVLHGGGDLRGDFDRLWDESALDRPGAVGMMVAIVHCVLIELARRCARGSADGVPDGPVRHDSGIVRAVLFVDRHFREPLTLAGVAGQAHLSANYFSERFREVTGSSFQSYLQHRRLTFARSLLASTDLGVTEVCHAAGFNSLSHFGRAYRNRYGASPTALRSGAEDSAARDGRTLRSAGLAAPAAFAPVAPGSARITV